MPEDPSIEIPAQRITYWIMNHPNWDYQCGFGSKEKAERVFDRVKVLCSGLTIETHEDEGWYFIGIRVKPEEVEGAD